MIKKNRNADASAETSKMKGYWVRLAARQKEQRTTVQMVGGETENLAGIDFRNGGTQGKLSNKPQVVSDINALIWKMKNSMTTRIFGGKVNQMS